MQIGVSTPNISVRRVLNMALIPFVFSNPLR